MLVHSYVYIEVYIFNQNFFIFYRRIESHHTGVPLVLVLVPMKTDFKDGAILPTGDSIFIKMYPLKKSGISNHF